MKTEIEKLIERLASKELTFGCLVLNEVGQKEHIIRASYSDLKGYWKIKTDGTAVEWRYEEGNPENEITIIGHPILPDTVFKHMWKNWKGAYNDKLLELLDLWGRCNFKSIQEIYAECEWGEQLVKGKIHNPENPRCGLNQSPLFKGCYCFSWEPMPKQSHIRELFQFLLQLGL